jgi:cholesterol oxidase
MTATAALPQAEVHAVPTSDGTEVRLTRYRMGDKGPLVLAPGYGNAARAFAVDTVRKNWVQYLGEHGYDVWLLDYRASPDLPSSWTQFTVDDIALRDWPAAIATVRGQTGADSVQAMGHCVGGLSLFMAIGGGLEGLRSAHFSALAGHPIPTVGNQIRAGMRMATLFRLAGIEGLNTDYNPDSGWDRAVEALMKAVPFRHVYDHPVARRR